MFDWNDMRYFLEVLESGSSAGAARKLGVNQGTVSRRIAALEEALNLELFDRTSRGLALKPEATWLKEYGEAMKHAARGIEKRLEGQRNLLEGVVRVATVEEIASMLIVPQLGEFRKQWPGIAVELLTGLRTLDLDKREADVSLRLVRPTKGDVHARKVGAFGYGIYAGDEYIRRVTEDQSEQIDTLDWMMLDQASPHLPEMQWINENLPDIKPILTCTSPKTLIAAVQSNMGVALLPRPMAYLYSGLNRLPIDTRGAGREIWLVVRRDMRELPVIQAVMDFLVDVVNRPLRLDSKKG